jgi:hypothetical protein
MTTTTDTNIVTKCTPYAIVLLIALCYIVFDEIKCVAFRLSCKCSKYESEAIAVGKLDTRSELRKRAFDHHDTLET